MKAISIPKEKYEAEEERLARLEQQRLSNNVENKIVSIAANIKGKKMRKTKQNNHLTSDGDEKLPIAAVSASRYYR